MRDLPGEFVNEINKRAGLKPRVFLIFTAQNRETKQPETLGLWNGVDHQTFTIDGVTTTFYGAGGILGLGELENAVGTMVRSYTIKLAPLAPEVATLIRVYNPRAAKVRIYSGLLSTESGLLVTPQMVRRFKGQVNKIKIVQPASGGNGEASITLVSAARNLTLTVPSRRSDENQRRRNSGDGMLKYASTSGTVETPWGSKRLGGDNSSGLVRNIAHQAGIYR